MTVYTLLEGKLEFFVDRKMFQAFVLLVCLWCGIHGQELAIEPDFLKAAKRLPKFTDAKTGEVYKSPVLVPSIFADSQNDIIAKARQLHKDGLTAAANADPRFDVSSVCLNHTEIFLSTLVRKQTWAFRSKPIIFLSSYIAFYNMIIRV